MCVYSPRGAGMDEQGLILIIFILGWEGGSSLAQVL